MRVENRPPAVSRSARMRGDRRATPENGQTSKSRHSSLIGRKGDRLKPVTALVGVLDVLWSGAAKVTGRESR